ncbi:endonuclease [Psychrobacillus vulpis]|uniref:Endonuclease/exonuclease/phosphatase n=1 Tax=Psychrobacillus vulpis TaxID=2325572 RepID=A0A544TV02_9BACI|nr:endonuclease [Psychrobacillus vulpis]TQR21265.1 endonuclease/exonuclease/phosphatase [Psychrobacillus vulpis]
MSKRNWKKPINAFLSASLIASLIIPGMPTKAVAATNASDLIISEYIEGGGENKALELYNGTGNDINLKDYTLEIYSNGALTASQTLSFAETDAVANGATYVLVKDHSNTDATLKSKANKLNSTVINFNGDDPIVLRKNGTVVDSIGQIGKRIENLKDITLVRNSNVTTGDTNPEDAFEPSAEWGKYPKDTFDYLASHIMDSDDPGPVETKVEAVTVSLPSSSVPSGTEITLSTNTKEATIYYTVDESDPTNSSSRSEYLNPIVIDKDMTIKAIAMKDGLDNSEIAEFTYTITSESEVLSIADARALKEGEVKVKGIVTALLKNTLHFQDETGALAVFPKSSLNVQLGDEIIVMGTLSEYNGLLQLQTAKLVGEPVSKTVPNPIELTGAEVNEENESKLAKVNNVIISGAAPNYTGKDAQGTQFVVRDENSNLGLVAGTKYESITGIVQEFNGTYQIIPRSMQDIVADSSTIQPVVANPTSGTFVGSTTVTLSTTTAGAEIYYTLDGKEPTKNSTKYTTSIVIDQDTTIKAIVITSKGSSEVKTFEYKITNSLQIHDIQGAGHTTSFNNQTVQGIEGIVTYSFTLNGSTYYHIQTPDELADNNPNTSEAILLYSGSKAWPIQVGDLVSVTGKVSEFAYDGYSDRQETDLKTTQINVRNDQGGSVVVVKSGIALPAPIIIDETNMALEAIDSDNLTVFNPTEDAIDFWESIEGMRVQVGNVKAVAPQEHGDLITVLENAPTNSLHGGVLYEEGNQNPNRIQFRLEPNGPGRDFEVATGDKFTGPITGVVGYSFQNFKIYVSLDSMKAAHKKGAATPEKTTIVKADDKLTIASYNLENFSNNKTSTSDDKARKLARAIATDMQSPDIVGVTEVQDNNGESTGNSAADQSYARLIAAIKAAGGVEYKYVNIDPENNQDGGAPNANIRVGFLYNPARVSLTPGISAGNATTAVGYEDGKLTLNPGRIDPTNSAFNSSRKPLAAQFDFQGESVVVIANHWNSKSGDTPLFGSKQPPVYESEAQRHKIANIVYNFVNDIKTKNSKANVVSLGDFNDYQFSQSLKIHEGNLITNMINKVETSDRYTYLYQGNSQVLDHILVSKNLEPKTKIDILHINADFTDMAGRASDHDPVMVQIDLLADDIEVPIEVENTYNITKLKTKKLTIGKRSVSVTLDNESVITEGILFTGAYAEFNGAGFAKHTVTIKPASAGAIIDFKGVEVQKVIIDGTNVKEIRGAENIQEIEFINGATSDSIKFTNVKGEPIEVPSFPSENKAPIVKKPIPNKDVKVGETISILLTDHFSDPENDKLTYTATKGTIQGNTLTLTLEEGTHVVGVTASDGKKSVTASFSVIVTSASSPTDEYYKDAFGKEGQALKAALHEIIDGHTQLSYDQAWEALRETDEDPKNKNNVILFYSGESRSKSSNGGGVGQWNREHTWAQSHGKLGTEKGPGTDIHHLRPTDVQVNSSRGNLDFDNGGSPVEGCNGCFIKKGSSFEPPDRVKGDVARILFYMATRYEKGDKVDLELNEKLNNGSAPYHGKLSVLLKWHEQDPVDEFERNRNNVIQKWQGNRNPFIDHPEWVNLIWKQSSSSIIIPKAS